MKELLVYDAENDEIIIIAKRGLGLWVVIDEDGEECWLLQSHVDQLWGNGFYLIGEL